MLLFSVRVRCTDGFNAHERNVIERVITTVEAVNYGESFLLPLMFRFSIGETRVQESSTCNFAEIIACGILTSNEIYDLGRFAMDEGGDVE